MGHRALVAYERPNGQYNLHYSHWGGCNLKLKHEITAETPFAGGGSDADRLQSLFEALVLGQFDDSDDLTIPDRTALDVVPEPWALDVSREDAITEHLDFHLHDAFYVVDQSFDVTAYRTFWFGLQYDCQRFEVDHPTVGFGALKTVRWQEGEPVGDIRDRGKWEASKDIVGDMLDRGVFTERQALNYLKRKLVGWTRPQETLIVRDQVTNERWTDR